MNFSSDAELDVAESSIFFEFARDYFPHCSMREWHAVCGGMDGCAYVVHLLGKKLIAELAHYERGRPSSSAGGVGGGGDANNKEDDNDMSGAGGRRSAIGWGHHKFAMGGVDGTLKARNSNVGSGGGRGGAHSCSNGDDGACGTAGGVAVGIA